MAMEWDAEFGCIRIDGVQVGENERYGQVGVPLEPVADVSMSDWLNLLSRVENLHVFVGQENDAMCIHVTKERRLKLEFATEGPSWDVEEAQRTMSTLIEMKGLVLCEVDYSDGWWYFDADCPADDMKTADLFVLQAACAPLFGTPVRRYKSDNASVDTACRLLRAGAGDTLIGTCESEWLEVKSQGYDLDSFSGQVELAQDVARFANSEDPAMLVLGFRTKRQNGVDRIVKSALLNLPNNSASRYREVIERRVYPPIEGLSVERIQMGERAILMILIPRQPDHARPFLVHGAIVDGKNEGTFISIMRRRGEESIAISPGEIHAFLSAGRAALGKQPKARYSESD